MTTENESNGKLNNDSTPKPTEEFDIPALEEQYSTVFKHITKLDDGDIITRVNCKFCNHPARVQAERKFEQANRTNFALVLKFFKDWESQHPESDIPPMNEMNVRSHLLNHYLQQEKRIWMREYGDRLKEIMNYRIDQDHRFAVLISTLELKLHEIASNPTLDPMKQADTMAKLTKAICDIVVTRGRLKSELESEQVILNKVASAWHRTISLTDHPEAKRRLMDALDTFKATLEGVVVPDDQ